MHGTPAMYSTYYREAVKSERGARGTCGWTSVGPSYVSVICTVHTVAVGSNVYRNPIWFFTVRPVSDWKFPMQLKAAGIGQIANFAQIFVVSVSQSVRRYPCTFDYHFALYPNSLPTWFMYCANGNRESSMLTILLNNRWTRCFQLCLYTGLRGIRVIWYLLSLCGCRSSK